MKIIVKKILNKLGFEIKKKKEIDISQEKWDLFFKYKHLTKYSIQDFVLFDQKANMFFKKYQNFTMMPFHHFYENLLICEVFKETSNGSIVECGSWRGGMIASIAELIGNTKSYYVFDSFEGLPDAQAIDGESAIKWQNDKTGLYYFDNCKAEIEYADKAMTMAKVKDYKLIKGWFSETLPDFKINDGIGILRLDSDWYDSTMTCLNYLYPLVNKGGLIIIDDYYTWDGCSKAIHDYLSMNKLPERIFSTPGNVAYILKTN